MIKNIISQNAKGNWVRPWNEEKFDDLFNRDERFFAILLKGMMGWLNQNLLMYNKPINHFISNTGSTYLYVESNGYEFSMNETSSEDYIYMKMPRCVLEIGDIQVPMEELSNPYVRGTYERRDGNVLKGYNAQMQRLPIEMQINARYVMSNFNETIILIQEIIDRVSWQKYFNITYLGQVIQCSLEIDNNYQIQFNKIDMDSTETNQKIIEITYKLCSNYPLIDERTEIENSKIIESFKTNTVLYNNTTTNNTDIIIKNNITSLYENDDKLVDDTGNKISAASDVNHMTGKKDEDTESKQAVILAVEDEQLVKTTFSELKKH